MPDAAPPPPVETLLPPPPAPPQRAAYESALALGGTALCALSARISLHPPGAAAPFTMQTLAACALGALLGPWRGAACLGAYAALAAAGAPVLAPGPGTVPFFRGLGAGYVLSFPVAAAVSGAGFRDAAPRGGRQPDGFLWPGRRAWDLFASFCVAHAATLAVGGLWMASGAPWLARRVGPGFAWRHGVVPFLPGAVIKSIMAVALVYYL
ncbi:BioY family-domain-containing protein [Hyaloraphidium curvatum]|nr:BioY family-domain-containing protein [Hyaloraphidium curvatum]